MHGQNRLFLRKQIIQDGENRFFDFPGITRSTDQNQLFAEINDDKNF